MLAGNGFSGTDLIFRDYESDVCHEWAIIVSTAVEPVSFPVASPSILIIVDTNESSVVKEDLATLVQAELTLLKVGSCKIVSLEEAAAASDLPNSYCIFLGELEHPILRKLEQKSLTALQSVLKSTAKVLWVSNSGGSSPTEPYFGMATGLSRVLRTENMKFVMVTLALNTSGSTTDVQLQNIMKVFQSTILVSNREEYEAEYFEKDGILHINRVVEDKTLDQEISIKCSDKQIQLQKFGAGLSLKLDVGAPGLLDTLRFIEDEDYAKPLGHTEVEVEVRAVGVNFRDCLIALGRLNTTDLGSECSGVVKRVGKNCSLSLGTRVSVCYLDTFRRYTRCPEECAIPIPDNLSFIEAASVPTTFTTVYHSLCEVARIRKGESILIHAAAGGTGQAAIQVAKYFGAVIYVTVGSEDKKQLLVDLYGIPEAHVLYSRDLSFVHGIKRLTEDRGVDIILNSLSGEGLVASWECIAPFGRFIEIGKKDIQSHKDLPMFPFAKNVSFNAVDLMHLVLERPSLVRKSFAAALELLAVGAITTASPLGVYDVSDIEKAFRLMQSGKNSGKTVIEFNDDSLLQVADHCTIPGRRLTNISLGRLKDKAHVLI